VQAIDQEAKINELISSYQKSLDAVMNHIKNWTWNDPISSVYKSLFVSETIFDHVPDQESFKHEMDNRYSNEIPPGYQDKNKVDGGFGDLLIWYTIIEIANKKNKDIIFVSGEEKSDWFYKSEGQILYPRFELICEFKAKTSNKHFHIIKLSEMVELFGITDSVVTELEIGEKIK